MTYHIDIQYACNGENPVKDDMITLWAETVLKTTQAAAELTIRFVEPEEMTALNHTYRHQNKPTNVLAFPTQLPATVTLDCPLLGDVIICPAVLLAESEASQTPLQAHWAHIIVHGILHLLGFDHIKPEEAQIMEQQEIAILSQLGFDNPYTEDHHLE